VEHPEWKAYNFTNIDIISKEKRRIPLKVVTYNIFNCTYTCYPVRALDFQKIERRKKKRRRERDRETREEEREA
jgi:hypothetical protein